GVLEGRAVEALDLGRPVFAVPRPDQLQTSGAGRTAVIIAVRAVACRGHPQLVASHEAETSSSSTVAVTSSPSISALRVENVSVTEAPAPRGRSVRFPCGVATEAVTGSSPGLVSVVARTALPATHRVVASTSSGAGSV